MLILFVSAFVSSFLNVALAKKDFNSPGRNFIYRIGLKNWTNTKFRHILIYNIGFKPAFFEPFSIGNLPVTGWKDCLKVGFSDHEVDLYNWRKGD